MQKLQEYFNSRANEEVLKEYNTLYEANLNHMASGKDLLESQLAISKNNLSIEKEEEKEDPVAESYFDQ